MACKVSLTRTRRAVCPVVGLLVAATCSWHPVSAAQDKEHRVRAISEKERGRLEKALTRALALLPVAGNEFLLDAEERTDPSNLALWDPVEDRWSVPASAHAERVYAPPSDEDSNEPTVPAPEIRVWINGPLELPSALATVGADPEPFEGLEAPAVVVRMIGAEPEGRVALPLDADQAANALTVIRIYVGRPALAGRVFDLLEHREPKPIPASPKLRPGDVDWLTIEIYGGRRDTESLARRVPVKRLRSLLTDR